MSRDNLITVGIVTVIAISVIAYVAYTQAGPDAGYNVILMNPTNPNRAIGQWVSPKKPNVVPGGVEWIDALGRYRLVSGTVYVEQVLLSAAPVAAPEPEADRSVPEPEIPDGD